MTERIIRAEFRQKCLSEVTVNCVLISLRFYLHERDFVLQTDMNRALESVSGTLNMLNTSDNNKVNKPQGSERRTIVQYIKHGETHCPTPSGLV